MTKGESSKSLNNSISEKIVFIRAKKNLSQGELAKELGITRSYLSCVECGSKNASKKLRFRIGEMYKGFFAKTVNPLSFTEKFAVLFASKHMTQQKAADLFGVNHRAVGGWLHGAMPRPGKIKKIAEYFGVPVNVLTDATLPLPAECSAGADSALLFLRGAINARLVAALSDYADQSGDSDAKEAAKFVALVFAKISTSNR